MPICFYERYHSNSRTGVFNYLIKRFKLIEQKNIKYWRKNIKLILQKIKQYIKVFFENEKSAFPFVILVTITALLLYNNSLIVSAQKKAYESYRIANELSDSSEDLTKYVRAFVVTGDPRYEEAYWQVLNIRNGKAVRPDGRKIPLNVLVKHLGFTNDEQEILDESQANSDKLVKKEVIAINAIKGIYDVNISKLIKPNESKRDFAIRIINDESYNQDKANIMNPINNVIQLVDKRMQIELMHYNVMNLVFIFISFFIVLLLFIRFILLINSIKLHLEMEKVTREIIEIMRSSIDINSVKSLVVREIGVYLKADRVFFVDYDSVNHNFSISEDNEYKSSPKIKSYAGNEMAITQGIVGAIRTFSFSDKDLIFSNLDKYIKENNINDPDTEASFRDMGCSAMMLMHINYGESFYGDIMVTFEQKRKIKEEEINFVKILADQAGIAIYHSKLYEKEKEMVKKEEERAEREILLRKIFETISSSLDLNIVKNTIVTEIGKALNADRCFICDYDESTDSFMVDQFSEYRSSDEVISLIGINSNDQNIKMLIDFYKLGNQAISSNVEQFIKQNNLEGTPIEKYFQKYNVKTNYSIPIFKSGELLGSLIIHYTKDCEALSQENIDFLKILAVQAGEAMYHARLYEKVQLQAEKENLLRKIFETIRGSLDFNTVKNTIVNEVGKALNADRCFLWGYDKNSDGFMVDQFSEYRSSDDIISLIGINSKDQNINWLTDFYKLGNEVLFNNVEQFIKENNLEGTSVEQYFQKHHTKANYSIPIIKSGELLGSLIVQYTKDYNVLSQEDINFVETLANQAGVAIYQSQLYEKEKEIAEKENLRKKEDS